MSTSLPNRYEVRAAWIDHFPLIGWITFPTHHPANDASVSENQEARSPRPGTLVRAAMNERPSFEYSLGWCSQGFALGLDCPLKLGVQKPLGNLRTFGFIKDRQPHPDAELFFDPLPNEAPPAGWSPYASKSLLGAILLPDPSVTIGGLLFVPESGPALTHQSPMHINDLTELVFAFHAFERGKNTADEQAVLRRAALNPDERLSFTMTTERRPIQVVLPSLRDAYDVPFWRAFALKMARACGIETVDYNYARRMGESVLTLERFDRLNVSERVRDRTVIRSHIRHCASSTTLAYRVHPRTGRPVPVSYLSMADILNREGAAPGEDLPKLWDRLAYTLLTNRSGDRPERWQFIREPHGWRLAPAHQLEWAPVGYGSRQGGITADGRKPLYDVEDCVALAPYFGLRTSDAKMRLMTLRRALRDWESIAVESGANPSDVSLMASLFE